MLFDPFYRSIEKALSGPLNPELFERYAQDSLQEVYPGLVPIRGGKDSGMDGAIADTKGEAFPLVVTTAKETNRNLKKSLESYVADGGVRRKVVFATSRLLTPPQRESHHKTARSLGFTLIQVHDASDFANRLYRSPNWCKELLGLSGRPTLLDREGEHRRPKVANILVGRQKEVAWLNNTSGDRVLIGQPGSGKTAMVEQKLQESAGWFFMTVGANGTDEQLSDDLRRFAPDVVVVDDAHTYISELRQLVRLRRKLQLGFDVIATTWPTGASDVKTILSAGQQQTLFLERLTRDEVKEIIEQYFKTRNLAPHSWLVRELVDQAAGQPGLAITLAHLCANGDIEKVVSGDALMNDLFRSANDLVGPLAKDVLAGFALGGDQGFALPIVANSLGLAQVEVRRIVTNLAAAGILIENQSTLTVIPHPLRCALVNATYFSGPSSLDARDLVNATVHPDSTASVLIGCRGRGGEVSDAILHGVMDRTAHARTWRELASLGATEAAWIVRSRPERVELCEPQLLDSLPELMVPILLSERADSQTRAERKKAKSALIKEWIQACEPKGEAAIETRLNVIDAAEKWLEKNPGRHDIAIIAICQALDPGFHIRDADGGSGRNLTVRWGLLPKPSIERIQAFWERLLKLIPPEGLTDWRPLLDLVETWTFPQRKGPHGDPKLHDFIRGVASRMVGSLLSHWSGKLALRRWALEIYGYLGVETDVEVDGDFLTIYPLDIRDENWRQHYDEKFSRLKALAENWAKRSATEVMEQLRDFDREARSIDLKRDRLAPHLCGFLAQSVSDPFSWAVKASEKELAADLVEPFVWRAVSIDDAPSRFASKLSDWLEHKHYGAVAALATLSIANPPEQLLAKAINKLPNCVDLYEVCVMRGQVHQGNLRTVLVNADPKVQLATLWGLWHQNDPAGLPVEYHEVAKRALVHETQAYRLNDVFEKHPEFAKGWLEETIEQQPFHLDDEAVASAVLRLGIGDRKDLIDKLDVTPAFDSHVLEILVGTEQSLFEHMLSKTTGELKKRHLIPLGDAYSRNFGETDHAGHGPPDSSWIAMAQTAMKAGYTVPDVVDATMRSGFGWMGSESEAWNRKGERWAKLEQCDDPSIQAVGKELKQFADKRAEDAARRERYEGVWERL